MKSRRRSTEGAVDGIRCNAIAPGFVATPATESFDEDGYRYMVDLHLAKRAGTPDDIAPLAVFLASDESSWVTGQIISVDGGATTGWR